jgi:hypothetical protein
MTGRSYKIDGERYPSVTTVLSMLEKSGLATWRGHVGNQEADRISKEATDYGTAIHALVETVNRGQRCQLDADEQRYVAPYTAWFDEFVSTCVAAEKLLVSRRFRYAGTTDAIVVMRGDQTASIVDFKSSKTDLAQREWALQTAAYALAAEEDDIEIGRRIIVRIPKNDPERLYLTEFPEDELLDDQRAFLAVLKVWRWHELRGPVKKPLGPRIRFSNR